MQNYIMKSSENKRVKDSQRKYLLRYKFSREKESLTILRVFQAASVRLTLYTPKSKAKIKFHKTTAAYRIIIFILGIGRYARWYPCDAIYDMYSVYITNNLEKHFPNSFIAHKQFLPSCISEFCIYIYHLTYKMIFSLASFLSLLFTVFFSSIFIFRAIFIRVTAKMRNLAD